LKKSQNFKIWLQKRQIGNPDSYLHAAKPLHPRDLKGIFENLLPCCCYAKKADSRTIRSGVSQPASAGKEADLVN